MEVILKETIESLGIIGSIVNVKNGYARNYLLPQKKAVPNTLHNLKLLEREKVKVEAIIAKEKSLAQEMAKKISGAVCKIAAKVSEEDRLYGSVSAREIVESLEAQGIVVEKNMVLLAEPIKTLGTFSVPVRVYKGVKPTITVEVVPE